MSFGSVLIELRDEVHPVIINEYKRMNKKGKVRKNNFIMFLISTEFIDKLKYRKCPQYSIQLTDGSENNSLKNVLIL